MLAEGFSVFNALVSMFADPPSDFDPDGLLQAFRRVDSEGFRIIFATYKAVRTGLQL